MTFWLGFARKFGQFGKFGLHFGYNASSLRSRAADGLRVGTLR